MFKAAAQAVFLPDLLISVNGLIHSFAHDKFLDLI
jgi:hypothetical protein